MATVEQHLVRHRTSHFRSFMPSVNFICEGGLMRKHSGCTIKEAVGLLFLLEKILGPLSNYSLQVLTVFFHLEAQ